jgi:proline dehydrogenase
MVTGWSFSWRAASRFVAGESLHDAIDAIKGLNLKGINTTLDHLGEHTSNPEKAIQATRDVIEALTVIEQTGVRSNVSIKLTQIGLALDENLCKDNLERILKHAQKYNNFVRIDMEDSPWVEKTLTLFRYMKNECGCDNVGIVIQSYLYRSERDVAQIIKTNGRVRLCKGAYQEPEDIAFPKKNDVDNNFDHITEMLVDGALSAGSPPISEDGKIPPMPAIATHDENRINHAKSYQRVTGLARSAMEFQMLYGIRRDIQEQLASDGYPVRVYVPYGTEWYPYYTRRLAERPANLWFFISNLFRK